MTMSCKKCGVPIEFRIVGGRSVPVDSDGAFHRCDVLDQPNTRPHFGAKEPEYPKARASYVRQGPDGRSLEKKADRLLAEAGERPGQVGFIKAQTPERRKRKKKKRWF